MSAGARGQGRDRHRRARAGLGRAIVELFVEEGAQRRRSPTSTPKRGEAFAAQLGAAAAFKRTDVADADQVQAAVDFAVERFGGLHVMCNNAGIGGSFQPFLDDDFADFDRVMAVNIFGVMVGSQRAARHMAEHGGGVDRQHHVDRRDQRGRGRDGVSRHEGRGHPLHPVDRRRARRDTAIRVNCVAPAHIPTAINASLDQSLIVRRDAAVAARRARRATSRRPCSTSRAIGPRRSPESCCPSTAGRPPVRRPGRSKTHGRVAEPTSEVSG